MVLSGMSTLSQVADNTSFMKDFKPLTDKEKRTLDGVVEVFSQLDAVPCNGVPLLHRRKSLPEEDSYSRYFFPFSIPCVSSTIIMPILL